MVDVRLAPSPFDLWAADNGYDITPAVSPTPIRIYADRDTQAAYDAFNAGNANADAKAVAAASLIDVALHFKLDPKAAKCLNAALAVLSGARVK